MMGSVKEKKGDGEVESAAQLCCWIRYPEFGSGRRGPRWGYLYTKWQQDAFDGARAGPWMGNWP